MPLKIDQLGPKIPEDEMLYGEFFNCFLQKFLRNIYSVKQLKQSNHLSMLENYYEIYEKFIRICMGLLSVFNSVFSISVFNSYIYDDLDLVSSDLTEFMEDNYGDDTLDGLKNRIMQTEI